MIQSRGVFGFSNGLARLLGNGRRSGVTLTRISHQLITAADFGELSRVAKAPLRGSFHVYSASRFS